MTLISLAAFPALPTCSGEEREKVGNIYHIDLARNIINAHPFPPASLLVDCQIMEIGVIRRKLYNWLPSPCSYSSCCSMLIARTFQRSSAILPSPIAISENYHLSSKKPILLSSRPVSSFTRPFTTSVATATFPTPSLDPPKHEMVYFPQMTTTLPSKSAEFRRVLWTGLYSQVVLMNVAVNREIDDEVSSSSPPPPLLT